MKTAISLPDELFDEAERLAHQLGVSRSALMARALRTFITRQLRASVTERLNAVYAQHPATADLTLLRAGWRGTTEAW